MVKSSLLTQVSKAVISISISSLIYSPQVFLRHMAELCLLCLLRIHLLPMTKIVGRNEKWLSRYMKIDKSYLGCLRG